MSSEVETSREAALKVSQRDSSASLGMTELQKEIYEQTWTGC
jgi:hypothetical protein